MPGGSAVARELNCCRPDDDDAVFVSREIRTTKPRGERHMVNRRTLKRCAVVDILLVEDDHELRESLAQLLGAADFKVARAANGAEALEMVARGLRPRLVLLDLEMPVMDGWEFLRLRRNRVGLRNVPVVVTTGHDAASVIVESEARIAKPVDFGRLLDVASTYLGGASSDELAVSA
jgi:CheY-like chemotaxis protein